MAKARKTRFRSFYISVTEKDLEKIKEGSAATTCRSMSEYVRRLIFRKPVTVCYRNRAFDEFIEESIRLRKTLVQLSSQGSFDESERMELLQKIEGIRSIIIKISETCSQK